MHLGQRGGAAALLQQLVPALIVEPAALRAAVATQAVCQQLAEGGRFALASRGVPAPGWQPCSYWLQWTADSETAGLGCTCWRQLEEHVSGVLLQPCCKVCRQVANLRSTHRPAAAGALPAPAVLLGRAGDAGAVLLLACCCCCGCRSSTCKHRP